MSETKDQRRLRALQNDIDRARARIESCRVRREKIARARERAFASENWISAHKHIEKLKPLFAEERAASKDYMDAVDALSLALEKIERRPPEKRRPGRK